MLDIAQLPFAVSASDGMQFSSGNNFRLINEGEQAFEICTESYSYSTSDLPGGGQMLPG
jgi:hypothetical protein